MIHHAMLTCGLLRTRARATHKHTECRGFCFAAPVAIALKVPYIPMRKPGKLPSKSIGVDFKQSAGKGAAYFGKDRLEMHEVLLYLPPALRMLQYMCPICVLLLLTKIDSRCMRYSLYLLYLPYYLLCVLYMCPLTTVKVYAFYF